MTHSAPIPRQTIDSNLDNNGIHELIIADSGSCGSASFPEWVPGRGFTGELSYTFGHLEH